MSSYLLVHSLDGWQWLIPGWAGTRSFIRVSSGEGRQEPSVGGKGTERGFAAPLAGRCSVRGMHGSGPTRPAILGFGPASLHTSGGGDVALPRAEQRCMRAEAGPTLSPVGGSSPSSWPLCHSWSLALGSLKAEWRRGSRRSFATVPLPK